MTMWDENGRPSWNLDQTIVVSEQADDTLEGQGLNPAPRFRTERRAGDRSYVRTWVMGCHFP